MAKGEESLKLEIARLDATSDEARARIPAPLQPASNLPIPLITGALSVLVTLAIIAGIRYRSTRKNL